MATSAISEKQCPNCGGYDVETDPRYGNKLKWRELWRRVVRSPLFWIGLILVGVSPFLSRLTTSEFPWTLVLTIAGLGLIVLAEIPVRRSVYHASDPGLYPEARSTCRACGHQWTSEEVPTDAKLIEPTQAETEKSDASDTLKQASSVGSGVAEPKRQGAAVVIGALAGMAATLGPPFCMLTSSGGEICSGYQVDVAGYYGKLIPLALVAAVVGALFGRAIGRSRRPAASDANQSESPGCAIAAAVVVGIGWMLVSLVVAIIPGC